MNMAAELEIVADPALPELAQAVVRQELVTLGEEIVASMREHHQFTNRTGKLEASFTSDVNDADELKVGSTEFYGRFLEEGTSRMPPQPFLLPALMDHAKQ